LVFHKKGQIGFYGFMIAVLIILSVLALATPLNKVVTGDKVMGVDGLNCNAPNITNQQHANCTSTDSIQPLWIFVGLGLAVVLIRRAFG